MGMGYSNCRTSKVVSLVEFPEYVAERSPFDRMVTHLRVNNGKGRGGIPMCVLTTREASFRNIRYRSIENNLIEGLLINRFQ